MNAGGWCIAQANGEAHVVPKEDMRLHYYVDCPCHPRAEEDGVIVHTSYDGREAFETGERKVS